MLNEDQLGEFIDARFTRTLFRLETLDHIEVAADTADFDRYQRGLPGPDMAQRNQWLDVIRDEVAHGKHTYRVHVVRSPLTTYLRFCFEWGYVHNAAAGERIGILDETEQAVPGELIRQDFWLIDGEHLVLMHYDRKGRFAGASVGSGGEVARYRVCANAAWQASAAFEDYWNSHTNEWRDKPATV